MPSCQLLLATQVLRHGSTLDGMFSPARLSPGNGFWLQAGHEEVAWPAPRNAGPSWPPS
jgi:hypothetical protein